MEIHYDLTVGISLFSSTIIMYGFLLDKFGVNVCDNTGNLSSLQLKDLISFVEVTNITSHSCRTNKLRNIYTVEN